MHTSSMPKIYFAIALLFVLSLFGCKSAGPNSSTNNASQPSTADKKSSANTTGSCYNAYYPATPTLKKTYKITYGAGGMSPATYTESYINLTSDGFVQKLEFAQRNTTGKAGAGTDIKVEGGVKCKPDGLAILEYGNLTAGQNMKFKYKTMNTNGISFPNDAEWQVGKKWQMVYDVEGQMLDAPKTVMNMATKGAITIGCEIIGKESITVPTGTYDTFKVAMTYNPNLKMTMMGREVPMNMTFKSTTWFAKDIGMVKSIADEFKATTELMTLTR